MSLLGHEQLAGRACVDGGDGCCAECGVSMVACDACEGVGYHAAGCEREEAEDEMRYRRDEAARREADSRSEWR